MTMNFMRPVAMALCVITAKADILTGLLFETDSRQTISAA